MKRKINNIIKKSLTLSRIKLFLFRKRWKKHNRHNMTNAKNCFNEQKVSVGKGTYGDLDIRHFGDETERLEIGSFCSIAPECVFLLGGEHSYNKVSTYPFMVKYGYKQNESFSKGPVIVSDDVWIGFRSTILSGVTIGKGAVIAAGSVVASDVPPYSIVAGVPARVIKYRFSDEIIEKVSGVDYECFNELYIEEKKSSIDTIINDGNVDCIVEELIKSR